MKDLIVLCLLAMVAGASAQCPTSLCTTMKWGTCDGSPCTCTVLVGNNVKQPIDCTKLVPKCFLMQAEMYRAKRNLSTRSIGGKPVETAVVDNDGIYDPECESDGRFKAVQCNGTETCWCVNSAGVRRSDKGDKNIKCEPVETYWVRLQLTHNASSGSLNPTALQNAIKTTLNSRYNLDSSLIKEIQYDPNGRMIVVDVRKEIGQPGADLPTMAYYCEKDVKVLPLFSSNNPLVFNVDGQNVSMEKIVVYYVDEKAPTFTMTQLTGGVIAVIVVVILVVLIGLLVLFFLRRREKAKYSKAQPREMEAMS